MKKFNMNVTQPNFFLQKIRRYAINSFFLYKSLNNKFMALIKTCNNFVLSRLINIQDGKNILSYSHHFRLIKL